MSNSLVEILVRRRLWQLALVGCPKKSLEENLVSEGKKVIVDNLIRKHAVYMIGKVANKIDQRIVDLSALSWTHLVGHTCWAYLVERT